MSDAPMGQRQHRQDEHRGLPLATTTRSGYLSPTDKALLDALRVAGVAPQASTSPSSVAADIEALQVALARVSSVPDGTGVSDHGKLTGLADDDHTQYHSDARGDLRYAPLAKGVTNGDTHDHNGGDGAKIPLAGMQNLAANSLLGNNTASAATPLALTVAQAKAMLALVKGDVGLGNVDNTTDAGKPVSTAQAAAIALKADAALGVTGGNAHDHAGGDGGQVDHGGLGGLADDDHTQYLRTDGTRTLTGDLLVTALKKIDGVDISNHDHSTLGTGYPVDHGNLNSLGNDHHTQYHTNARGDARYPLIAHTHTYSDIVNLIPRDAALGGTTPPVLTSTAGTNFPYQTLNFVDGARGAGFWQFAVPSGYDGVSSIAVRMAFVLGTSLNLVVRMDCNAGVPISDAAWDAALAATGVGGSRNYGIGSYTAGDLYTLNVNWTSALPVANSFVILQWGRDGAHAGDTCTDTVKLLGIRLTFPCVTT